MSDDDDVDNEVEEIKHNVTFYRSTTRNFLKNLFKKYKKNSRFWKNFKLEKDFHIIKK